MQVQIARPGLNNVYGYDPVTFKFDSNLTHTRWETFQQQKPVNQIGFWAVGILGLASGPFVVQLRGLNGSLGLPWMYQNHAMLYCIVIWHIVLLFEFRRGFAEKCVRYWFPSADARRTITTMRTVCIHFLVLLHPFTHLAFLLRSYEVCSPAAAASAFSVVFCNGTQGELPADGYFFMIGLAVVHQWVYPVPWAFTVFNYVVGLLWTLLAVRYQRAHHIAHLTVQQQNAHVFFVLCYLAVSFLPYNLQVVAINEFVAHDRAVNFPQPSSTSTSSSATPTHVTHTHVTDPSQNSAPLAVLSWHSTRSHASHGSDGHAGGARSRHSSFSRGSDDDQPLDPASTRPGAPDDTFSTVSSLTLQTASKRRPRAASRAILIERALSDDDDDGGDAIPSYSIANTVAY